MELNTPLTPIIIPPNLSSMTNNTDKPIALVTGASRGIGAATAKALAAAGYHVVLLARSVRRLEKINDAIEADGGSATIMPLDLTELEQVDAIGPAILERFGRLGVLIGNAGMLGTLGPLHQAKPEEFDSIMTLNATANYRLIRTLDPLLRSAPKAHAIFVTAGIAKEAKAYWGPYSASKRALEALVSTYKAETLKTNITVELFDPGIVDTAMLRSVYTQGVPGAQDADIIAKNIVQLTNTEKNINKAA